MEDVPIASFVRLCLLCRTRPGSQPCRFPPFSPQRAPPPRAKATVKLLVLTWARQERLAFRGGSGDRLQILLLLQDFLPKEQMRAVPCPPSPPPPLLPQAPARSPPPSPQGWERGLGRTDGQRDGRGGWSGRVGFSLSIATAKWEKKQKSCRGAAAAPGAAPGWALGASPSPGPAAAGTARTMPGRAGVAAEGSGQGAAEGGWGAAVCVGGAQPGPAGQSAHSPEERGAAGGTASRGGGGGGGRAGVWEEKGGFLISPGV